MTIAKQKTIALKIKDGRECVRQRPASVSDRICTRKKKKKEKIGQDLHKTKTIMGKTDCNRMRARQKTTARAQDRR